jgi:hypothetical protein
MLMPRALVLKVMSKCSGVAAAVGKHGAEVVGEVVQDENSYRLCYIRGPEGSLIGLAQELGQQTSR